MQQEITEISKNLVHEALKNALTGSCDEMQYSVGYILYNLINLCHVESYCSLVMYTCTICESLLTKFHSKPTNASTPIAHQSRCQQNEVSEINIRDLVQILISMF